MGRYIFPPRPKTRIKPAQLRDFETGLWICQRKFSGTRVGVEIEEGNVSLYGRHGRLLDFRPPRSMVDEILSLKIPKKGRSWLDGELLTKDSTSLNARLLGGVVVFFDLLEWGGEYLFHKTQTERLELLASIIPNSVDLNLVMGYCLSKHLYVAQSWDSNFLSHYQEFIDDVLVEGLVLRRADSYLGYGSTEYDVDWQVKARKPSKSYRY